MKYPRFTGEEPCAQVGVEHFFTPEGSSNYTDLATVKAICADCPSKEPCLEYALHVNVIGVWGGTTEPQRRSIRKERGIIPLHVLAAS